MRQRIVLQKSIAMRQQGVRATACSRQTWHGWTHAGIAVKHES